MPSAEFSLTEYCIINPVLGYRASPLEKLSTFGKIGHFLQSELLTRIMAVATSVFAALDTVVHLGSFLIKGGQCILGNLGVSVLAPALTCREVGGHLMKSLKFASITLIGSVAAVVWPGVLKYFIGGPDESGPDKGSLEDKLNSSSDRVRALWANMKDTFKFKELWKGASLKDKRSFVKILDASKSKYKNASSIIASIYDQVKMDLKHACDKWSSQKDQVFYHATSKTGLEGILKTGRVEVRHEKAFRGAFVSSKPELGFGDYILVFKRNIERLSALNHGFEAGDNAFWAGFSRNIPVNEKTLSHIMVVTGKWENDLPEKCKAWAGKKVEVIQMPETKVDGNILVPEEWKPGPNSAPLNSPTFGSMVLENLKQRALQVELPQENSYLYSKVAGIFTGLKQYIGSFVASKGTKPKVGNKKKVELVN